MDLSKHMLWLLNSIDFLILAIKLFAKFSYRLSSLTPCLTLEWRANKHCGGDLWFANSGNGQNRSTYILVWLLITFLAQIRCRHDQIEKGFPIVGPRKKLENLFRRHIYYTTNKIVVVSLRIYVIWTFGRKCIQFYSQQRAKQFFVCVVLDNLHFFVKCWQVKKSAPTLWVAMDLSRKVKWKIVHLGFQFKNFAIGQRENLRASNIKTKLLNLTCKTLETVYRFAYLMCRNAAAHSIGKCMNNSICKTMSLHF